MRYFQQKYLFCVGLVSLLCLITPEIGVADSVAKIIKHYGGVVDNPRRSGDRKAFKNAKQAFAKVKLVTTPQLIITPKKDSQTVAKLEKRLKLVKKSKLVIVKGRSDEPFVAAALADGKILLSKRLVRNMYRGVSPEEGNARLAFILGHELAHIAYGHVLPKAFMPGTRKYKQAQQELKGNKGRKQEGEADEAGFVYAAMAGYTVDELLREKNGGDFFVTWQKITGANWQANSTHPSYKQRAQSLYNRLKFLLDRLHYFHFGVRLSHFNRCYDGLYLLKQFKKVFPAREVWNNIGYCHLQTAREKLGKEAYLYWLPSMLDVATQIDKFDLPGTFRGKSNPEADKAFKKAQKAFKNASQADISYFPAYVNLAVTSLYLEDLSQARLAINHACQKFLEKQQKSSKNIALNQACEKLSTQKSRLAAEIQGLYALISYHYGQMSYAKQLLSRLAKQNLAKQDDMSLAILYNAAQILPKWQTHKIWQRLAQHQASLPEPIREVVCKQTSCRPLQARQSRSTWPQWLFKGVQLEDDELLEDRFEQRQWKPISSYWQTDEGRAKAYQHHDGSIEVLEIDGYAKMAVLKNLRRGTITRLRNYCGQTLFSRKMWHGELRSCGDRWAALIVGDKVKEIWVVKN